MIWSARDKNLDAGRQALTHVQTKTMTFFFPFVVGGYTMDGVSNNGFRQNDISGLVVRRERVGKMWESVVPNYWY